MNNPSTAPEEIPEIMNAFNSPDSGDIPIEDKWRIGERLSWALSRPARPPELARRIRSSVLLRLPPWHPIRKRIKKEGLKRRDLCWIYAQAALVAQYLRAAGAHEKLADELRRKICPALLESG